MAQYVVTRTSIWSEEKPVEEAFKRTLTKHVTLKSTAAEHVKEMTRKKCERYVVHQDMSITFYIKKDAWVCDIPDLCAFVEKYGRIILMKPDNEEGLWFVEIYDDYRE